MSVGVFSGGNFINSLQAAGKNAIINGDFGVWQRGTSFSATNLFQYTADRWFASNFTGVTGTVSRQSFTPGTAPVSGYEGTYFAKWTGAASPSSNSYFYTRLEDVRLFAAQTITYSFWAKAASAKTIQVYIDQNYGSGGSATTTTTLSFGQALTTSWTRYSFTGTLGSISGKTIGTSSFISPTIQVATAQGAFDIDIWGVQLEAGSTATAFQTATGTIQGELAACQRYYVKFGLPTSSNNLLNIGNSVSATNAWATFILPVQQRIPATAIDFATLQVTDTTGTTRAVTSLVGLTGDAQTQSINATCVTGLTTYRPIFLQQTATTSFIAFFAEL